MATLYLIREMNLKGAKFSIYNEVYLSESAEFIKSGGKVTKVIDKGQYWEPTRYYSLSDKPKGYNMDENTHLPYFARVTEDLPGSCKGLTPKVYERCQLTTSFPGGYLIFQDLKTKKRLKIAMNSHTYDNLVSGSVA
jgi:hypothetical protein